MSVGRLIESQVDVDEGAAWLAAADPALARALDAVGPLPLRRRPDGFAALLQAIVSQQVSVAAASAITARMEQAGYTTPDAIRTCEADALRGVGLSRQKVRYAQALAASGIDFEALRHKPDGEVVLAGEMRKSSMEVYKALETGFNIKVQKKVLRSGSEEINVYLFRMTLKATPSK